MTKAQEKAKQGMRDLRVRQGLEPDPDGLKELLAELLANTAIHHTGKAVEVEWNFSRSQWQVVHLLAHLQGVTASTWLEGLGRKLINSRGDVEVGQGTAIQDTDDLDLGG